MDFLKRNFSWVENDICSQTLVYGSLLICGHRFFMLLVDTLFYITISILFKSDNVPIFCFTARKMLMRSMNISFYSHKRITTQLLIMHNFASLIYYTLLLLPTFNIQPSQFYWSVFPHSKVFIKELSTNITSETSIMPSSCSN